jgi:hypothetical protein
MDYVVIHGEKYELSTWGPQFSDGSRSATLRKVAEDNETLAYSVAIEVIKSEHILDEVKWWRRYEFTEDQARAVAEALEWLMLTITDQSHYNDHIDGRSSLDQAITKARNVL